MQEFLYITLIAIAGPVIGSLIGVLHKPSRFFMLNMLSFAAGVMISISLLQLVPESIELSSIHICAFGIITGTIVMYLLDKTIAHIHPSLCAQEGCNKMKKTAIYLILGIFLHNFPEGMAMAVGFVSDFKLSLIVAIAIAIHDIPEGICTSAPYYFCSKKRLKAFLLSSSTAIATVVGFAFAYYFYSIMPIGFVGFLTAATAGIMIYISADELIPVSYSKNTHHSTIFSLMAGVLLVLCMGLL